MKILHCSDLHLESAYNAGDREKNKLLKNEALEFFAYLVKFAKQNEVEAVLICGDLFDKTSARKSAIKYIFQLVQDVENITFYYIYGNHDAKLNLDLAKKPENFQIIGDQFMRFDLDENISIGGISLTKQNVESFYNEIDFDKKRFNIFMLHADTAPGSHDPSEFSNVDIRYLKNKNINYLALGHIHKRSEGALDERGIYCNSGNCGNYGFGEETERGFVLMNIKNGKVDVTRQFMPQKRKFVTLSIDISKFQNEKVLENTIDRVLSSQNKDNFMRIKFVGYFEESFDKRIEYLTEKYKEEFFYFEIVDESKMKIDLEQIKKEKLSLKNEYLSMVFSCDELSDSQKEAVAYAGIQALRGEDINI